MNFRTHTLAIGLLVTASVAVLATGCDRQEAKTDSSAMTTPGTPPPATPQTPAPTVAPAPSTPGTPMGTVADDAMLTARVKTALLADAETKGQDIKVEIRNGNALLDGSVDSRAQADRAVLVASGVAGVKGIETRLTVKGDAETGGAAVAPQSTTK